MKHTPTRKPSVLRGGQRRIDWRRRMSDNIAYALLVYTLLQILVTAKLLRSDNGSLLPYLSLAVLVGAIVPACRRVERRWTRLDDAQASDPCWSHRFNRDRLMLWAFALGFPFVLAGIFIALAWAFR